MSVGGTTATRRVTRTCFRTCSTCRSRSQAPLYPYALCAVTNRAEGTFVRLRYSLGGDRPSQTTHLARSRTRIHGSRLEFQHDKAGISRTAPPTLAGRLHSLPAILHIPDRNPIPSYSKGSRGLSVPMRVSGIFTGATVSPSLLLRQRPSCYTIRAGRNLPDKEFRYLRTVRVTAAVYRGFGSELRATHGSANPSP
jgi:hypothetical protein